MRSARALDALRLLSKACCAVFVAGAAALALTQQEANSLAQYALSRLTLAGGVASVPRCGTGELAVAFVQNSALVVHAMASQDAELSAARAVLAPTGMFGRRAYLEKGAALALPYADNFVDMLVIADLTDGTLSSVSAAEVQRVLRPGGLALVGRAAGEGAGLTQAALQSWIGALANATVESNAQGLWAAIGKARPAGADNWSHRLHGPDNNPKSNDLTARWPYLPQWRMKPYNSSRNGTAVTANGRLYVFVNDRGYADYPRTLRVYRIYNGEVLWTRSLNGIWRAAPDPTYGNSLRVPFPSNASCMVADSQCLYLMKENGVLVINGETGSDGFVRCYNGATNTDQWAFLTGGRVYATPTVANGCVYVGSGDGYAYCLEAHTGRLVWRFRAAPVERRMNLFGHLASSWPVLSGVLVNNGVAYFTAGFSCEYGTHVYAVNAATGAIVWQNNTSGTYANAQDHNGLSPGGYMAVVGNRLWVRAYTKRNGVFDLATGAFQAVPSEMANGNDIYMTVRGREIGVIDSRHVVFGGRMVFADHNERGLYLARMGGGLQFRYIAADAQGSPDHPEAEFSSGSGAMPAWDSQYFYTANEHEMARWSRSTLTSRIDATATGGISRPYCTSASAPSASWTRSDISPDAVAVAANRVVVVYSTQTFSEWGGSTDFPNSWTWYVAALNPASGATQWEEQLPGEPLHGGIALGRNGNIYVMLLNGDLLCYGGGSVVSVNRDVTAMDARIQKPAVVAGNAGWDAAGAPSSPKAATAGSLSEPPVVSSQRTAPTRLAADPGQVRALTMETIAASGRPADEVLGSYGRRFPQEPDKAVAMARVTPKHHDTRWHPDRPCLSVTGVSASSSARGRGAGCTVDRSLTTRWMPCGGSDQWVTYDLGQVREVGAVSAVWHAGKPVNIPFALEVSADGKRYVRVDQGALAGRGTNCLLRSFVPQAARFVRLSFGVPAVTPCPSFVEVGIHETSPPNGVAAR